MLVTNSKIYIIVFIYTEILIKEPDMLHVLFKMKYVNIVSENRKCMKFLLSGICWHQVDLD